MKHLFIDAKDKYVGAFVVFGKASDSKLYVDAEYTTQLGVDEAADAFNKGLLLVKVGDKAFHPVAMNGVKFLVIDVVSGSISGTEFTAKALD